MDSAANDIAEFHGIGSGKLKGSARGALICVCFGSGWMYWAVVFSGSQSPPAVLDCDIADSRANALGDPSRSSVSPPCLLPSRASTLDALFANISGLISVSNGGW